MKKSDLSVLLKDTPETYYWIGFLLADGTFTESRLRLRLGPKDQVHVKRFGDFVQYTGSYNDGGVSSMCVKTIPVLRAKFGISNIKTYEPSKIDWIIDNKLFLALVIGFIDGDGSMRKVHKRNDYQIVIKCHSSWTKVLEYIAQRVCQLAGTKQSCVLLSSGYAELVFCNFLTLKFLKNKVQELNLPVLSRKWDCVNSDHVNKNGKARINEFNVEKLLNSGYKQTQVAKELSLSKATVCQILKRLNARKGVHDVK